MLRPDHSHPLALRIRKQMVAALDRYNMLESGDRLLVAVSGGKDSAVMLSLFQEIQRRAPFDFSMHAVMLDQKQPGFDAGEFTLWVKEQGISFEILEQDTYSVVKEKTPEGKAFCSLCSRMRRGILYSYAHREGFSKIALGHHRDDAIETLLLNLFYSGKIASMPPLLRSDDERNILIRPLCFSAEKEIEELAIDWKIPIMPCNLCGSQDGLKRKQIKALLGQLTESNPFINNSISHALQNVRVSQLYDERQWDFASLLEGRGPEALKGSGS